MMLDPLSKDADLSQFIQIQVDRAMNNLSRAAELVSFSKLLPKNEDRSPLGNEAEDVPTDILRSAVVFVHATMEEFLRSIESVLLPYCDETTLNNVPLAGTGGEAKSFKLGKLASHRGKSVLDVIRESVEEHLLTKSYGDQKKVYALLASLGVDVGKLAPLSEDLDVLIKRRHQIVHRADRPKQLEPITAEQVQKWIDVTQDFMMKVLLDITSVRLQRTERKRR